MSIKTDCIHYNICDSDSALDCANSKCDSYEPKRVKCVDRCENTRIITRTSFSQYTEKNNYCPTCGHKVGVKQ